MLKYVLLGAITLAVCIRGTQWFSKWERLLSDERCSHPGCDGHQCIRKQLICIRVSLRSNIRANEYSFCDADPPLEIDDRKPGKGEIKYSPTPKPKSWLIQLNTDDEDGILIDISSFDLIKSFLVIREVSEEATPSIRNIQFVSGRATKPFKFYIPYSKKFYMEICPEESTSTSVDGTFTATYQRSVCDYGEGPLPGEPPEVEKERQAVEVQFKGKSPEEFKNTLFILKFQTAVKFIARDYCLSAKIPFDENKSPFSMVTIHNIRKCPIEWSDREICTSIHHSVIVTGEDDGDVRALIQERQLTRKNLKKMWASATNTHLLPIGLTIYEPPDGTVVIGLWFATVILPFIIIVCLFYAVWKAYDSIVRDMQKHSSMISEAADFEARRKSKLKPNKYQQMPSFFKEEKASRDDGARASRGLQPQESSYSAALLFSRLKMESIPE